MSEGNNQANAMQPQGGTEQVVVTKQFSSSAVPLMDMTVGMLIIAQIPIMFGVVSGPALAGIIPWVLCAYPLMLTCVIIMFKQGDLVDASVNGVLAVILMGQNAVLGIIQLCYSAAGTTMPAEVQAGIGAISGMAFLVGGIILIPVSFLAMKESKITGIALLCAGIGFVALFLMYYGFGQIFGLIGACGIIILGIYLLITGIKLLFPGNAA